MSRTPRPAASRRPPTAPLCESLEPRLALTATLNSEGILIIEGSPQADTITIQPGPTNGSVRLSGVPGVANNTEFTNVLDLRIDLRSGNDILSITDDLFAPNGQPASLLALAGNGQDTLTLNTSLGTPELRGGNSSDTLNGGPSNDLLKGGRGIDSLFGNAGEDRLEGQLGRDLLVGGADNDSLFGGNQPDALWGNAGEDLLNGGRQRDILWGGADLDSLVGEQGADRFNGAPEEATDFASEDDNFGALFQTVLQGVLLGQTFWDRLAAGENPSTGQLTPEAVNATDAVADAFSNTTLTFRVAFTTESGLTLTARFEVQTTLRAVTDEFSPAVLNEPDALTAATLQALRDDLIAAAPATNGFNQDYSDWVTAFIQAATDEGYVEAVNALPANASPSQAHLFATDSIFSTEAWF